MSAEGLGYGRKGKEGREEDGAGGLRRIARHPQHALKHNNVNGRSGGINERSFFCFFMLCMLMMLDQDLGLRPKKVSSQQCDHAGHVVSFSLASSEYYDVCQFILQRHV